MTVQLGISCIAWEQVDDRVVLQTIAKSGIVNIELVPSRLTAQPESPHFINLTQELGLHCVAMQALLFGAPQLQLFADALTHKALMEHLTRVFVAGQTFGVTRYVFGSPKNRLRGKLSTNEALLRATEFFRIAAQSAHQHGGCLCIEANPADYGGDFILSTSEAFELVQAVGHPGFGLHLDTGGMILGNEDIAETIERYLPYIKHLHVSAPHLAPIYECAQLERIQSGLAVLIRGGYVGHISLEMKGLPSPNSLEARLRHIERGIQCLGDLAGI